MTPTRCCFLGRYLGVANVADSSFDGGPTYRSVVDVLVHGLGSSTYSFFFFFFFFFFLCGWIFLFVFISFVGTV